MLRLALIYGGIGGAITIGTIVATLAWGSVDVGSAGQAIGFLVMFIALSLIFFGIRQYRDQHGPINFVTGLKVGLAISAVATIVYAAGWELYLGTGGHNFAEDYSAMVLKEKAESGMPAEELAVLKAEMAEFSERYKNPAFRIPVTMTEIFPVGLLISLLSAWWLRRKPTPE